MKEIVAQVHKMNPEHIISSKRMDCTIRENRCSGRKPRRNGCQKKKIQTRKFETVRLVFLTV